MKKDEARFTIKFNPANPRHKKAIQLLNEAGRRKAPVIADALCMYDRYGADQINDLMGNGDDEQDSIPIHPSMVEKNTQDNDVFTEEDLWQTANDSLKVFFNH
jgi:hypothetical protein